MNGGDSVSTACDLLRPWLVQAFVGLVFAIIRSPGEISRLAAFKC